MIQMFSSISGFDSSFSANFRPETLLKINNFIHIEHFVLMQRMVQGHLE